MKRWESKNGVPVPYAFEVAQKFKCEDASCHVWQTIPPLQFEILAPQPRPKVKVKANMNAQNIVDLMHAYKFKDNASTCTERFKLLLFFLTREFEVAVHGQLEDTNHFYEDAPPKVLVRVRVHRD